MRFEGNPFFTLADEPARHAIYVRELLELLLFTEPGERVNRPDFGAGLLALVFEPNRIELAAAIEVTAQSAIQRWLGDLVETGSLRVSVDDSALRVDLEYRLRRTGELRFDTFSHRFDA